MLRSIVGGLLVALVPTAHADGVYFSQSVGIGSATGELEPTVGRAMRTRASLGARVRWLAIESWVTSDTQLDRDGGFRGIIGGEPAAGRSDLAHYGVDLKAMLPLQRTRDVAVEGYVRAGASLVSATGMLEGYAGQGLGAGVGFQLRGRVRALGFLWGPLFFVNRGPKVTAALFAERGTELVRLDKLGEPRLSARVDHTTLGFAVGSTF